MNRRSVITIILFLVIAAIYIGAAALLAWLTGTSFATNAAGIALTAVAGIETKLIIAKVFR